MWQSVSVGVLFYVMSLSIGKARVGAADLYREYREWAESTGDYVRRLNDFTATMEAAGYHKITPKGKKVWEGLRLDLEAKFGNSYAATV